MKRRYRVFVSYRHSSNDGKQGSGNAVIRLRPNTKNMSHKDISEIQKHLEEENNFDKVVILNYQIM